MSKVIVSEFGICHEFINDIRRSISKYFDFYT